MMLTFDQDVAAKIQSGGKKCILRCAAAVGYEQNSRGSSNPKLNDKSLIIGDRRRIAARRMEDDSGDVVSDVKVISFASSLNGQPMILKKPTQPLMHARPVADRVIDQEGRRKFRDHLRRPADVQGVAMTEQ